MSIGKPLSKSTIEDIRIDWRQGRLTQRDIASKYKISPAAVNKICKGLDRDLVGVVNKSIEVRQELNRLSEREVNAVNKTVDTIASRLEWLNEQAMKNVSDAMKAEAVEQVDFRSRADTILKAKETLVGKTPETAIQINNQQNGGLPAKIVRTIVDPRASHSDTEEIPATSGTGKV